VVSEGWERLVDDVLVVLVPIGVVALIVLYVFILRWDSARRSKSRAAAGVERSRRLNPAILVVAGVVIVGWIAASVLIQ
jgi:heme/copper-type cytochrome/quinol oxidase subunit 2